MKSSLDTSGLKTYAIPLAALVVVGVCVPLILMPGYQSLQDNLKTQTDRHQLINDLSAKVQTLEAINIDKVKALLTDPLEIAVPAEADAAGLLGSLEKLAQDNGVSTRTVNYAATTSGPASTATTTATSLDPTQIEAKNVTASMSVVGPYDRIMTFITKAESSIRLTNITSISMTRDESVESSNTIIAMLNVESPFVPHPTNLGPAELPLPKADLRDEAPLIKTLKELNHIGYSRVDPTTIQGRSNPF